MVYSMFDRESRLVLTEARLKNGFQNQSFDPARLAEATDLALKSITAPHQPLNVLIDENATTFDVRTPANSIEVALQDIDGTFSTLSKSEKLDAVQAVVLNGKLKGLTPKEVLQKFPTASLFISNSENGLQIEADHLVMDGAVMETIMAYLLCDSTLTPNQLPQVVSDRESNIHEVPSESHLCVRDLMKDLAKTSVELHGEKAKTWVTATRSTEDWNAKEQGENKYSRIIPVPIKSELMASEESYAQAREIFCNAGEDINESDVAKIVLQAVRNYGLSRSMCRQLVKASKHIPLSIFSDLPDTLTAIWPKIDSRTLDIPESRKNNNIGDAIESINAAINLFPKEWGPIVFARPSIILPTESGHRNISGYSLSGSTTAKMQEFYDNLSTHL